MAEIKVEKAHLVKIQNQLPEISNLLNKDLSAVVSNLEVIKKNIDSDGINTILSKFVESINTIKEDMTVNLNVAHDYLNNKLGGYQSVASKTDEQLAIVIKGLEEMEN